MAFTNVIQWNCEGIKSKFNNGDIHQLIKETNTNCLCLQETKLQPDANFVIKKFKSYLNNKDIEEGQHAHGGVAIFVRNFISSYRINLETELQAVAVSVKFRKRITLCSLYLPPGEPVSKRDMENLLQQLPKPFMILGDFNAHHHVWHDPRREDDRGKMLAEFIEEQDVALLDKNKFTSIWKVDKSFSHVDLSLCSVDLLTQFRWDVNEEPLSSDHFPILLKSEIQRNNTGSPKWITKKADWNLYRSCTEEYKSAEEFTTVAEVASFFETMVIEAAEKAVPKTKGNGNRQSPPWWNDECRTAIRKRKTAFRRYSRITSSYNYNRFSKARAEAKRVIKRSKKRTWASFINSINSKNSSKEIWHKINLLTNRYKSQQVTTLKLNPKQIKISNIPKECEKQLEKELSEIGCIQNLKLEDTNEEECTAYVRYEEDRSIEKAMEIDNTDVQGHKVKAEIILPEEEIGISPVVLDDPKDIADCLGRRFAYISGEGFCDPRFKEVKDRKEREKLDFSTEENFGYNRPITTQELEYAMNLADDSSPGPDQILYSMLKNLAPGSPGMRPAYLLNLSRPFYSASPFYSWHLFAREARNLVLYIFFQIITVLMVLQPFICGLVPYLLIKYGFITLYSEILY